MQTFKTTTRSLGAALLSGLIAVLAFAPPASAIPTGLTEGQVSERLAAIGNSYQVGELLSPEDQAFVKEHAVVVAEDGSTPGDVRPLATVTEDFSKSGSGAGATGNVTGTLSSTIGDFSINNSWSVEYTATGSSNVTSVDTGATIRAYGTIGEAGIGLVYSADPSASTSGSSAYFARSEVFTAFVVYLTVTYSAVFHTPEGSFNISY